MRIVAAAFLCLAVITGCKEETIVEPPDGRIYFPLHVGHELEYRVDSIIFDDGPSGNVKDTFSGFVLERITERIPGANGDSVSVVERSFRRDPADAWTLTDIWTISTDQRHAFRTEENLPLVKFLFPVREDLTWLPTAFIDDNVEVPVGTETIQIFSNWGGSVESLGQPAEIGGQQFEDVLDVYLANDDNAIERRFVREWYAAGVGLVARADTILDSQCKRLGDLFPCLEDNGTELVPKPWVEIGEKGYILRQEIIRHN